jgi:hypothetical protein
VITKSSRRIKNGLNDDLCRFESGTHQIGTNERREVYRHVYPRTSNRSLHVLPKLRNMSSRCRHIFKMSHLNSSDGRQTDRRLHPRLLVLVGSRWIYRQCDNSIINPTTTTDTSHCCYYKVSKRTNYCTLSQVRKPKECWRR